MEKKQLTHLDADGKAHMVDVGSKPVTHRFARASAEVVMSAETIQMVKDGLMKKGDVLTTAQIAGILAAKQTAHLIPLCHPIMLEQVGVSLSIDEEREIVTIISSVSADEKTGVEMEAMTAVSIAALTVYDMVKSVDKSAYIRDIKLIEKKGGKSGDFFRE